MVSPKSFVRITIWCKWTLNILLASLLNPIKKARTNTLVESRDIKFISKNHRDQSIKLILTWQPRPRMAPTPLQHRRTHNTLLLQKLLNLRDGASPFTLVLDSLEQGGAVIIAEFKGRAKVRDFASDEIFLARLFLKSQDILVLCIAGFKVEENSKFSSGVSRESCWKE